jgi:predicted RNase H-like nuclease (RuvC/YqgF family)
MIEDDPPGLKRQITDLTLKLEQMEIENEMLIKQIQDLEDELLEFHGIIAEGVSFENIERVLESKFKFELKAKDREIRDLKNKLGFLRKEKLELERKLEEFTQSKINSSVLRVEDIRREQSLEHKVKIIESLEQQVKDRDKKIDYLNSMISKNKEERVARSKAKLSSNSMVSDKTSKDNHKTKIKKYKRKIQELKDQLHESGKDDKSKIQAEIELLDLKNTITRLQKKLEYKNQKIKELESRLGIPGK